MDFSGTPSGFVSSGSVGVQQVAVELIQRNPSQPRLTLKAMNELNELAASIREHGVIQPLIVLPKSDGTFTLIAGERRLQASQRAGLKTVPVIPRQANNQELLEIALIENVQRADLNAMEEAEAYRHLVEDFGLSHEMVARRVGKSRVAVTNTLRLLGLADTVKQALVDGKITEGHARALLALSNCIRGLCSADGDEFFDERSSDRRVGEKACRAEAAQSGQTKTRGRCERCGKTPAKKPRHESRIEVWKKRRHSHHLLLFG